MIDESKIPDGMYVSDVTTLAQTYTLRGRILCWLFWRMPLVRRVTRALAKRWGYKSPYSKVVAVLRPKCGGVSNAES